MDFKHLVKIIYRTLSLITFASVILLLVSFISSFDMVNGYFTKGILPVLFEIFFVLGIILSFTVIIPLRKGEIVKTHNDTRKQKNLFLALAIILFICSFIFNVLVPNKLFILSTLGACFFAGFAVMCALMRGYEYSHLKLVCLLLSAAFPLFMVIDNNSVVVRHSNSVENKLSSVFAIAFLLYVLYEGKRIFTGEHSKWHFASMLLLTHTGFPISISYITVYLMGIATETTRFYQMILVFIISIFVEIELIRFCRNALSHTKSEWEEIESTEKTDE